MEDDMIDIAWQENKSSIIKVLGVGGGGGNAVTYMYQKGIHNVNFVICNTDSQALKKSNVPVKIQLGELGAGGKPEIGRQAALDSIDKIREVLENNTKMVFVTAGMGGGTGTGAAPVIARIAKEMGILTVAIVTIPFRFEGPLRIKQAFEGIKELKDNVDALLVIDNEKLREMYGNLKLKECFSKADNVLTMAAKGIAELITLTGEVNVDFADVQTIMTNGGVTVMGSASASGENRALEAVEAALNSPLLNNNDITGARRILLNITSGTGDDELTMDEMVVITDYVTRKTKNASMIWGTGNDEALGDAVNVTVVATDFHKTIELDQLLLPICKKEPEKKIVQLSQNYDDPVKATSNIPVSSAETKQQYFIREKPVATQTKIKWDIAEPATEIATETFERAHTIPSILDENADIDELENTSAYIRKKKVMIDAQLTGTEREVSKYTLSSDKANTVRLRENNPYLYNRVD